MKNPNNPEQGSSEKTGLTLPPETDIYRVTFIVGEEEQHLWFKVSNPNVNLPLFEKVTGVVEHLLEPSAFQTQIIKKAIIEEFEKHGFKQHQY